MVAVTECRSLCETSVPQTFAYAPCFICPGPAAPVPTTVPPSAPNAGETEQNTPPNVLALNPADNQYFLVGSGIPAQYSQVSDDGAAQVFLAPLHAANAALGPGVGGAYDFNRDETTDELSVVYGVAMLNGSGYKITDYYDVVLTVTAGGGTVKLTLVPDANAASGYAWAGDVQPTYRVVDSVAAGSGLMVQNVIRLDHLIDAGLPATATNDGDSVWELTATRKTGGPFPFTPKSTITVKTETTVVLTPVAFTLTTGSSGGDIGYSQGVYGSFTPEPLAGYPLIEIANRSNQNFQVAFTGDCSAVLEGWTPVVPGLTLTPLSPPPAKVWNFDGTNTTGNFTTPQSMTTGQEYNVTWSNA